MRILNFPISRKAHCKLELVISVLLRGATCCPICQFYQAGSPLARAAHARAISSKTRPIEYYRYKVMIVARNLRRRHDEEIY